jgi:hypothetical protein
MTKAAEIYENIFSLFFCFYAKLSHSIEDFPGKTFSFFHFPKVRFSFIFIFL